LPEYLELNEFYCQKNQIVAFMEDPKDAKEYYRLYQNRKKGAK